MLYTSHKGVSFCAIRITWCNMLTIVSVKSEDLYQVVVLFKEYAASLDFELSFQNFEVELANLPGEYGAPEGRLLLGLWNGQIAGCVALRKINRHICEMKRLYVRPPFRGNKIGKSLAEMIIQEARKMGYSTMRLDTVPSMERARSVYERLGFRKISPYRHNPIPGALFLELDLTALK